MSRKRAILDIWIRAVTVVQIGVHCSGNCDGIYSRKHKEIDLRNTTAEWFQENMRCLNEVPQIRKVDGRNVKVTLRDLIAFLPSNRSEELKSFYVKNSDIPVIYTDAFGAYINIEKISLENNNIRRLEQKAFFNSAHLRYIDLSYNTLVHINSSVFVNLPKLDTLYLYYNRLKTIADDAFISVASKSSIFRLHIHDNQLQELSYSTLSNTSVTEIYLNDNNLTTITDELFPLLDILLRESTIKLGGNPWKCDCELTWLVKLVQRYNVTESIVCNQPENMSMVYFHLDTIVCNNNPEVISRKHSSKLVVVILSATGVFMLLFTLVGCTVYLWRKQSGEKQRHCKVMRNRDYYCPQHVGDKQDHSPQEDGALLLMSPRRHSNARYRGENPNLDPAFTEVAAYRKLRLKRLIGRGAFGEVYEGFDADFDNKGRKVAVKRLRDNASPEEMDTMIKECENMIKIGGHPNIIEVYGTSIINGYRAIVMELAEHGDLREFLRKCYTTNRAQIVNLDKSEETSYLMAHCPRVFLFLWHITKGMEYLSDLKILHRDLASRNILLAKGPIAKISDFGLSRDVYESGYYYQESGGRLPYKWMSPETLINGKYTAESDVWSYGILAWEVVTLGSAPFPGIPPDMLISMQSSGYIMPQPSLCPDNVYSVMVNCWKYEPEQRPTFKTLVNKLDEIIQRGSKQNYVDLSVTTGSRSEMS